MSSQVPEPTRAELDALEGATLLEFGTGWCGYCQAAQPDIRAALEQRPDIRHIKIEDGKGRPLGRQFGVKLWPTLVLLRGGRELARVVRPQTLQEVIDVLTATQGELPAPLVER